MHERRSLSPGEAHLAVRVSICCFGHPSKCLCHPKRKIETQRTASLKVPKRDGCPSPPRRIVSFPVCQRLRLSMPWDCPRPQNAVAGESVSPCGQPRWSPINERWRWAPRRRPAGNGLLRPTSARHCAATGPAGQRPVSTSSGLLFSRRTSLSLSLAVSAQAGAPHSSILG